MMTLLLEVCKMQNFEALEAATGRAALKLAVVEEPDLVLLDVRTTNADGQRIDGREQRLTSRRVGGEVPTLVATRRLDVGP